ncbi:sensor histidine kinase [Actinopolymorpha alba]|uniref:sensor histidine kinase n=1 Tax=Actinopolymorpha alba TaxID=533267 RepID=UPI000377EE29|nr:ATP-binding protein [Actinopolymorpha alba]
MRALVARQPLRRRVLALVLLLTAVVLLAGGLATTNALQTYLLRRTDQQLSQLTHQTASALEQGEVDDARLGLPPEGALRFLVSGNGSTSALPPTWRDRKGTPVELPTADAQKIARDLPGSDPQTLDVAALCGPYRFAAMTLGDGSRLVVGLPLHAMEETVRRLLIIELAVGEVGLVVTAVLGSLLIRVGLSPLARITATTGRIASADLTGPGAGVRLRVPEFPPQTEVGQLGSGLNHMLDAIDGSFDARNEAESQLRQFIADASHELRTPLATIRGYAELSERSRRKGDLDLAEMSTAMRRIADESARMSLLVDDLLLLARLDQGRPLAHNEVDLCRLAVDAANDFRVRDDQRPIRLDVPAEALIVSGDEARLRQVLANLLANVHFHTPPGTGVDLRVVPDDGDALVAVHDNGPGVPTASMTHVFDRFYRGDTSRNRASGGTGLGLAIVQAVVDAHHGSVVLDSTPGSTTVSVRLPLDRAASLP